MNDWRKSFKKVSTRIHSPLVGMAVFNDSNDRQILFQASLAGDVFYQKFHSTNHYSNTDKVKKLYELNKVQKDRCTSWLSDCFDAQYYCIPRDVNRNTESESKDLSKQIDHAENLLVESSKFRNDINMVENCHSNSPEEENALGNENSVENLEVSCKTKQSCSTQELWTNFEKLKKENKIMTRASLNLSELTKELDIFTGNKEDIEKPLSKVLFTNWNAKEYVSLATFAPNISLDS